MSQAAPDETPFERVARCVRLLDSAQRGPEAYDVAAFESDTGPSGALLYAARFVQCFGREFGLPDTEAIAAARELLACFEPGKDPDVGFFVFADGFPHQLVRLVHDQMRRTNGIVQRKLASAVKA